MKKVLSVILLGSLVMSTGVQAGPWNKGTGLVAAIGTALGSFALYVHYDIQKNKQKTKNAVYNKEILGQFLEKAENYKLVGEPGTLEQIESLHIDANQRIALITAIDAYDKALLANANAINLLRTHKHLNQTINSLLNDAHKITNRETQGDILRFMSGTYAATVFSLLGMKYYFSR